MKKFTSIFKPKLARNLLKMGNLIYDIKADKLNTNKTIFIFENTSKIQKDIKFLQNKIFKQ